MTSAVVHDRYQAPGERELEAATIPELVGAIAHRAPGAPALLSPGHSGQTYGQLKELIDTTTRRLHDLGLGRGDRVALALPTGPELAAAWIALTATATAVPLNPGLTMAEIAASLPASGATAVIVPEAVATPARTVGVAHGLLVIDLVVSATAAAGEFTLVGRGQTHHHTVERSRPDDIALVLHTSGTTGSSKRVPLTHANLLAATRGTSRALGLTDGDRGLVLGSLFHISGISQLVMSLIAGAAFIAPRVFDPDQFFVWLEVFRPTWWMAVPTMHRAILACVPAHADTIARCRPRFIRSGAASLPPPLLTTLETVFGAPLLEGYGMTETGAAITSNPLPPRPRKPGSSGVSVGPEIGIVDEAGELLPSGTIGEIVVRGPNVMRGYENDADANRLAFTADGWFRTGDLGYFDAENYLFVTGRLKELINRGGEKVAPHEVEAALLAHSAVTEAIAFGVPDARLGEEVAAAVVLRDDGAATEGELRGWTATRLAPFKIPRRIVLLPAIPTGPTGKVRRQELAASLGLVAVEGGRVAIASPTRAPNTAGEVLVATVWSEVLGLDTIGVEDDFMALGGDSILAIQIHTRLQYRLGYELPIADFLLASTVADQARVVAAYRDGPSRFRERFSIPPAETIRDLVAFWAATTPDAPAVLAPDHPPISYNDLLHAIDATVRSLRDAGVGPNERVAVALPDGPELAVALLGVMSGAVAIPLHPALPRLAFERVVAVTKPRAVIVASDTAFARAAASIPEVRAIEWPPVERWPRSRPLPDEPWSDQDQLIPRGDGADLALVMHTSGTTGSPKLVPLSHGQLIAVARNVASAQRLRRDDRCLNFAPLHHTYGLTAPLLATLATGGSVICPATPDPDAFVQWRLDFQPTWYNATPATYRSILARLHEPDTTTRPGSEPATPLRFMRSAGARLASSEREALETAFAAPLLDGYGLTEAPQSVLNLLPPFPRKSGSVGVSIGPALAVVDESGAELPPGRVGEIVLRGPTVFAGYLEDESANERAFLPGGWFRTGDLGYLDPDGYLFLTGRLKEIINRGGEKVSPFEVEEILCSHPEVAQAIVFPLPDARLGEEVAAFIVPGAGAASRLSERELRSFASASLPPFKVPRRIIIGVELPVGPLGKVRRLDLARQLELTGALAPTASDDETCTWSAESVIARIAAVWGELLATAPTRSIDDFFTLGGDSILAARVAARIQVAFGVDLAAADLFSHPSLAEFTDLVETRRGLAASRHVDEDADDRSS